MEKESTILSYLTEHPFISTKDAEDMGFSKSYLYKLVSSKKIKALGNGLFELINRETISEFTSIIEVTHRVNNGVVSLISALAIYELTTELPSEVWITVPRGSWLPKVEYPPIQYITATEKSYAFGVTTKIIDSSSIKIYTVAKTIADCFKHRNKIGINVAIDSLKEAWYKKLVTMDEIVEAAKVNCVLSIMKPYLEVIVNY